MQKRKYVFLSDLPAYGKIAMDAISGITGVVEAMHSKIAGSPSARVTSGIPGLVYQSIRGIANLIGSGSYALARLVSTPSAQVQAPEREALLAALNGVAGDYLVATQNPLAISMRFRQNGHPIFLGGLSIPEPKSKLLVLVHGLCTSDLQWNRDGHDHGAALARDLGYTPIYLYYNSGLHISTNGREFAQLLERLLKQWPVPVDELVILAHSMGGLVARSAYQSAKDAGLAWPASLRKLVFLGTPHHGATLERIGNWVETALSANSYSAPFSRVGRIRSAGITDMRFGSLLDEDWENRDRFTLSHDMRRPLPLPGGVRYYAIAAVTGTHTPGQNHRYLGDGLVSLNSALGKNKDSRLTLGFPLDRQWVGEEMNHFDLLSHPKVYTQIHQWLAE